MNRTSLLLSCLLLASPLAAEEPALREKIQDEHAVGAEGWIYNDIARGFEEARRTGKPLFVTFRCVPCKDCEGFDAEVAKGNEVIQQLAAEHFVPVRQVEMKGVDLSQFQFDHDLNWAAMFLNADGTVYARYGTQSAAGADAYNSIQGLANTMRRVLELHENYPANKAELEGKRGPDKPYETALDMPGLENKEKLAGATARNNCIHCHMIHDAEQNHAYETGAFSHDLLWRYPLPE
ncbi:MAG TPA: thioredoxin family protein, partial [Planctomycetaceae bacterium]